ncbi:hypothetical protein EG329_003746 [Mollisiaceae sp. DMI_Dod_QoI]|nr:hypothetical protein EG329_003746 [Helotiales sp. DMI_Dod_QoI]
MQHNSPTSKWKQHPTTNLDSSPPSSPHSLQPHLTKTPDQKSVRLTEVFAEAKCRYETLLAKCILQAPAEEPSSSANKGTEEQVKIYNEAKTNFEARLQEAQLQAVQLQAVQLQAVQPQSRPSAPIDTPAIPTQEAREAQQLGQTKGVKEEEQVVQGREREQEQDGGNAIKIEDPEEARRNELERIRVAAERVRDLIARREEEEEKAKVQDEEAEENKPTDESQKLEKEKEKKFSQDIHI